MTLETLRPFGPLPVRVPSVGQGTWQMGEPADRRAEVDALRAGLDLGMTHIDTAEIYGQGRSEEMIAEALQGRRREDVFLVSKVWPGNADRAGTRKACEASLRRLRTDHLDCYLLHWPGQHPVEETMLAMEELVGEGKIRSLGVSNFDVAQMEAAQRALGRERLAQNQVLYHLGERGIEHDVLPFCEKERIAVVGYSPFGHGDFPGPRSKGGRLLAEIGQRQGATARQVALAFLIRRPSLFSIPKAARLAHVRDNAAAMKVRLSDEDIAAIDQAFPLGSAGPLATA